MRPATSANGVGILFHQTTDDECRATKTTSVNDKQQPRETGKKRATSANNIRQTADGKSETIRNFVLKFTIFGTEFSRLIDSNTGKETFTLNEEKRRGNF